MDGWMEGCTSYRTWVPRTLIPHPLILASSIHLFTYPPMAPVNHRHSFPLDPYDRQPLSGLLVCDIASSFHALSVLPSFIVTRSSFGNLPTFRDSCPSFFHLSSSITNSYLARLPFNIPGLAEELLVQHHLLPPPSRVILQSVLALSRDCRPFLTPGAEERNLLETPTIFWPYAAPLTRRLYTTILYHTTPNH